MSRSVLVVEDDLVQNRSLVQRLAHEGYLAEGVRTAAETRAALATDPDLVLLDLGLPDAHGVDVLRSLRESRPDLLVVVMAPPGTSIDDVVAATELGAEDAIKRPFEAEELLLRIKNAFETSAFRHELGAVRERERRGLAALIGETPALRALLETVRRVAASDAPSVLVTGELGTGKTAVARAIHSESRRALGPFVAAACTTLAEPLLERELFGVERGAFAGATVRKLGLLERSAGGTLLLDEVAALSQALQAKLLRFLEAKTFRRVGGARDVAVDVRVVAATHRPLPVLVQEGRFLRGLHDRLAAVTVPVPPLRERAEDVPLLARAFAAELGREVGRDVRAIAPDAEESLRRYAWPGNVRELRNAIERALILGSGDTIRVQDLPVEVRAAAASSSGGNGSSPRNVPVLPPGGVDLDRLERELLTQAIARSNGNKTRAGRLLGLNRDQVRYRLEKYGLLEEHPARHGDGRS